MQLLLLGLSVALVAFPAIVAPQGMPLATVTNTISTGSDILAASTMMLPASPTNDPYDFNTILESFPTKAAPTASVYVTTIISPIDCIGCPPHVLTLTSRVVTTVTEVTYLTVTETMSSVASTTKGPQTAPDNVATVTLTATAFTA